MNDRGTSQATERAGADAARGCDGLAHGGQVPYLVQLKPDVIVGHFFLRGFRHSSSNLVS